MATYYGNVIDTSKGDAYVAQQMATIDAQERAKQTPTTNPPQNTSTIEQQIAEITKQVQGITTQVNANTGGTGGTFKLPEPQKYTSDISSAMGTNSEMKSWTDYWTKEAERFAQESAKAQQVQATKPKTFLDYLTGAGKETPAQYRDEQFAKTYGGPASEFIASQKARIAELDTLGQAYNAKQAEEQKALETSSNRLAPMTFIRGEQSRIQRQYDLELSTMSGNINAKTAVMQMEQGNYKSAMDYVNQAVSDYTWGIQTDLAMIQSFYSDNQTLINNLDSKYQTALTNIMTLKQDELNTARDEKWKQLNYDLQVRQENRLGAESGITTTPQNFTEFMTSAIQGGATAEEAAQSAITYMGNLGLKVSQNDLTNLKNQATQIYNQIKNTPKQTNPVQPFSMSKTAENVGETLRYVPGAYYNTLKNAGTTFYQSVGSFFGGLFGY